MYRPAVHSFAFLGLLAGIGFQTPSLPPSVKLGQKRILRPSLAAVRKDVDARKSEYLKANEQLRMAWMKQEPGVKQALEKSGMKVEDLQKQAQQGAEEFGRATASQNQAQKTPSDAATAVWTRLTQLSDQVTTHLTSVNPAWRSAMNAEVRNRIGNQVWFEPVVTAVPTSLPVNSSTVVTHYAPTGVPGQDDAFMNLYVEAKYSQAGAVYDTESAWATIHIPANVRTARVVLRDAFTNMGIYNLVILGYGSGENKFSMGLYPASGDIVAYTAGSSGFDLGTQYAFVSESMQHSVFLVGGYLNEQIERDPTVELTWTRPAGNTEEWFHLLFMVETWAGGGPFGSVGSNYAQMQVRAFDVITNR